jgi:hypothetical protein
VKRFNKAYQLAALPVVPYYIVQIPLLSDYRSHGVVLKCLPVLGRFGRRDGIASKKFVLTSSGIR